MLWLKQSTAVTVKIGPFLDEDDGKTVEDSLTISQGDVRLSKNGGDIAQKNESSACTHDELGIYGCPLDTTDTGTLGRLQLWVHESGALPVWHEFMVVEPDAYDALCAAAGTGHIECDAVQISGDSTAADNAELAYDGTGYGFTNCTMPTVTTLTGHTAQTGDNYARLGAPAGASIAADIAENQTDLDTIITDTNELQTDWTDAGRLDAILDAIVADTNELQGDWTDTGRLDTIIDAIVADTNELQTDDVPGLIAALNNISATDVNTQVADVMKTDTISEMSQGAPPATPTFEQAVMYLYMALRNKIDVTSSLKEFHNDSGTVIWKKSLSDDGTTYSEAEGASGP